MLLPAGPAAVAAAAPAFKGGLSNAAGGTQANSYACAAHGIVSCTCCHSSSPFRCTHGATHRVGSINSSSTLPVPLLSSFRLLASSTQCNAFKSEHPAPIPILSSDGTGSLQQQQPKTPHANRVVNGGGGVNDSSLLPPARHNQPEPLLAADPKLVNPSKKFLVALDLGTARSGFAYQTIFHSTSPQDGPAVHYGPATVSLNYPRVPQRLPWYPKTLSAILYEKQPDGGWKAINWGWPARDDVIHFKKEEDFKDRYCYVERFKLGLYPDLPRSETGLEELPAGLTYERVTADYLRFLVNFALDELNKVAPKPQHGDNNGGNTKATITASDVQWSLAVPSGWPEAAKGAMRMAALNAGIIPDGDAASPALQLLHEAEAAAVHAHGTLGADLHLGEKLLVVDAGGGTTDLSVMEVTREGELARLSEATYRSAVMKGSTDIDKAFEKWLGKTFMGSEKAFREWGISKTPKYMELKAEWELHKINYEGPPGGVDGNNGGSDNDDEGYLLGDEGIDGQLYSVYEPFPSITFLEDAATTGFGAKREVAARVRLPNTLLNRRITPKLAQSLGLTHASSTTTAGAATPKQPPPTPATTNNNTTTTTAGAALSALGGAIANALGASAHNSTNSNASNGNTTSSTNDGGGSSNSSGSGGTEGPTLHDALAVLQGGRNSEVEVSHDRMCKLFDVVLDETVVQVTKMLERVNGRVDKIVLAGGLGSSPYFAAALEHRLRGAAGRFMVSKEAASAVMLGSLAVLTDPSIIASRRAAMTYGERYAKPWCAGAPDKEDRLSVPTVVCGTGYNQYYTRKAFEPFVHLNQSIGVNQVVSRTFHPVVPHQSEVSIELWATREPRGASYVTDPGCMKLVDARLPLDPEKVVDPSKYTITCEMHFGRAEVTLRAKDEQTGRSITMVAGLSVADQQQQKQPQKQGK